MSLNTLNAKHTGHFSAKPTSPKTGFVATLGKTILNWQTRASMRHRLSQLDQENLNDMGLDCAFVARETKKNFWQA